MVNIVESVKRYFRGDSNEQVTSKFESLFFEIEECRNEMTLLAKSIVDDSNEIDEIRKASSAVVSDGGSGSGAVAIAIDNIRFIDRKFRSVVEDHISSMDAIKSRLRKAEDDMTKLVISNPDIASIISDTKHDSDLLSSLETIFKGYSSGSVTKKNAILAYKTANSKKRTDMSFESVMNHLKDTQNG